jgi:hypothetical protein
VEVDLDEARASMALGNVHVKDFFTLANALKEGHHIPARVSFHIRWHGVKKRDRIRDTKNHFVGNFIEDTATIRWSAREKEFIFVSDPAHTSTTVFAEIGRERNGAFFS